MSEAKREIVRPTNINEKYDNLYKSLIHFQEDIKPLLTELGLSPDFDGGPLSTDDARIYGDPITPPKDSAYPKNIVKCANNIILSLLRIVNDNGSLSSRINNITILGNNLNYIESRVDKDYWVPKIRDEITLRLGQALVNFLTSTQTDVAARALFVIPLTPDYATVIFDRIPEVLKPGLRFYERLSAYQQTLRTYLESQPMLPEPTDEQLLHDNTWISALPPAPASDKAEKIDQLKDNVTFYTTLQESLSLYAESIQQHIETKMGQHLETLTDHNPFPEDMMASEKIFFEAACNTTKRQLEATIKKARERVQAVETMICHTAEKIRSLEQNISDIDPNSWPQRFTSAQEAIEHANAMKRSPPEVFDIEPTRQSKLDEMKAHAVERRTYITQAIQVLEHFKAILTPDNDDLSFTPSDAEIPKDHPIDRYFEIYNNESAYQLVLAQSLAQHLQYQRRLQKYPGFGFGFYALMQDLPPIPWPVTKRPLTAEQATYLRVNDDIKIGKERVIEAINAQLASYNQELLIEDISHAPDPTSREESSNPLSLFALQENYHAENHRPEREHENIKTLNDYISKLRDIDLDVANATYEGLTLDVQYLETEKLANVITQQLRKAQQAKKAEDMLNFLDQQDTVTQYSTAFTEIIRKDAVFSQYITDIEGKLEELEHIHIDSPLPLSAKERITELNHHRTTLNAALNRFKHQQSTYKQNPPNVQKTYIDTQQLLITVRMQAIEFAYKELRDQASNTKNVALRLAILSKGLEALASKHDAFVTEHQADAAETAQNITEFKQELQASKEDALSRIQTHEDEIKQKQIRYNAERTALYKSFFNGKLSKTYSWNYPIQGSNGVFVHYLNCRNYTYFWKDFTSTLVSFLLGFYVKTDQELRTNYLTELNKLAENYSTADLDTVDTTKKLLLDKINEGLRLPKTKSSIPSLTRSFFPREKNGLNYINSMHHALRAFKLKIQTVEQSHPQLKEEFKQFRR